MFQLKTLTFTAGLLALVAITQVSAQGVYRIVGPDGKVTFSDQPPATDTGPGKSPSAAGGASNSAAPAAGYMPAELRQAMSRYPVTLYTGSDCAPCASGRDMLTSRGIPFTEKTVNSNADIDAFKRMSGVGSLPLLAIGSQHLKGYSASEWNQYLDLAGYPKASALPSSFRRPAPSPMVEAKALTPTAPAARAPSTTPSPPEPAEIPVAPPVTNPSGIRF